MLFVQSDDPFLASDVLVRPIEDHLPGAHRRQGRITGALGQVNLSPVKHVTGPLDVVALAPGRDCWSLVLVFSSAGLLALACGGSAVADSGADASDGASDSTTGTPRDGAGDGTPDVREVLDAALVSAKSRCAGATYGTAPSGAACDPRRIEQQRGLEGSCYGPAVGAFCHDLQVSVPSRDEGALSSGFVCGSAELGIKTCVWSFGDDAASRHAIDDAALEGASAVTIALPTANVVCVKFGS